MHFNLERALELLQRSTMQSNAAFRENQDIAIKHVVRGNGTLLVVQKTG